MFPNKFLDALFVLIYIYEETEIYLLRNELCIQSHFIYIQSLVTYILAHLIYLESLLICIQSLPVIHFIILLFIFHVMMLHSVWSCHNKFGQIILFQCHEVTSWKGNCITWYKRTFSAALTFFDVSFKNCFA